MYEQGSPSPELYLETEQTLRWLSYAGNDERKLLILLALNHAGTPLSRSQLHSELSEMSGVKIPGNSGATQSFVDKSLTKIDAVVPAEVQVQRFENFSEMVRACEISPTAQDFGIPFAGALLQWSLDHPELSLNQVLGITHGEGPKQSPLLRYWMLYDLATTPDTPRGPSITHIAANITAGLRAKQSAVDRLVQFGVLSKETSNQNNQRQFVITDSVYKVRQGGRPFNKLKPETQVTFKTLEAAAQLKDTWGFDEFFELMEQLYPDIDHGTMWSARRRLSHTLVDSKDPFFKSYIEDLGGKQYDGGGKVALTADKQQAVLDLVSTVDDFCSHRTGTSEVGRKIAHTIASTPELFKSLYIKAYERSNYTSQDETIDQKVANIIESLGPLASAQAIRKAYSSESGRRVVLPVIYESLGRLIQKGAVQVEKRPQSKQKQIITGFYRIADGDQ